MNFTRQNFQLYAAVLLVFHLSTACPAWVIDANESCTWGIANSDLPIPIGSVPVGAILTLHNVFIVTSASDQTLNVYLLSNPVPGLAELTETPSFDPFEGYGVSLGTFTELTSPGENLTIDLAQVNNPQSWVWSVFPNPFTQTMGNLDIVAYSSALLDLLDYSGSGRSFGFGLYSRGIVCSGMTLRVTIQSLIDASAPQILEYTYGNIHAPQLQPISDYSISYGQPLSFVINASDADGDAPLFYTVDGLPAGAAFANQTFTWTPTEIQQGIWELSFSVSDGLLTDSQTMSITVNTMNHPPVLAFTQNVTIVEKEVLSLPVSAADPDGDSITITAANLPAGAVFNGSILTWLTIVGNAGTYQITFTASDGLAEQSKTLTLKVSPAKTTGRNKKH